MKSGLIFLLLLLSQFTFAQTLKEKKIKQEMLDRVETLIVKSQEARTALKTEDVVTACGRISDLFVILPDHLISIGTRMNLFDPDVIKMENETKMILIYIHQRKNICETGETGENLDIGETDKKLRSMIKAFEKQRKRIKKSDTDYENTYNYYYEFK
jgi:hypothetical protein